MENAGRKPPISFDAQSCPFCNDWSVALQAKEQLKSQEIKSQTILVRTDRFKRHVAAHLEQLAIFAIPRATEDDGEDKRSPADSLGSTITDLSGSGIQESRPAHGEGSLEGRSADDEDLPNADEGRDDDPSSPGQYARGSKFPPIFDISGTSTNKFRNVNVTDNIRPPFPSIVNAIQNVRLSDLTQEERTILIPSQEQVEQQIAISKAEWTAQEQKPFVDSEVSHMAPWVRDLLQARNEEDETSVSNSPNRRGKDAKLNEGGNMATATSTEELVEDRGATYKRVRGLFNLPTQNRRPKVGHPGFETVNTAQNKRNSGSVDSSSRKQHAKMQTTSSEKLVHEQ